MHSAAVPASPSTPANLGLVCTWLAGRPDLIDQFADWFNTSAREAVAADPYRRPREPVAADEIADTLLAMAHEMLALANSIRDTRTAQN